MENKKPFTARKLKPRKDSDSWVLEFRHPLSKDASGKPGKKIRRGLGTDDNEAEKCVADMNELLSNESYWQPSSRLLAQEKFDAGIVNAFYDQIDNYVLPDYEKVREVKIPLKTKDDKYSRVLLLGTTGAGKTTLVSQLIGLNPKKERFLAMSTSRTTVYDTEIVLSNSLYKCVVTFYSEGETRQLINESIRNAITEYFIKKDDTHTLRVFLEDKNQRFRLNQLIGKVSQKSEDYDEDENDDEDEELFSEANILDEEQSIIDEKIKGYLSKIKEISNKIEERSNKGLNDLSDDDKKALEELVIGEIDDYDEEDLYSIEEEIIMEIKERFKELDINELNTEKFGWPISWYHEEKIECPHCNSFINNYEANGTLKCTDCGYDSSITNDNEKLKETKSEFLKSLQVFSSNSSSRFGKLLSPLVTGMRVEGPFKPTFLNEIPKLVLIDGEGLGHNPNTSYSLPDKVIKKFSECDAIILVDNSQAPMLTAPSAVIKCAADNGHYKKLFLCFTHFDLVKGPNLQTPKDKRNHIFGSVENQLEMLKTGLGYDIKNYLSKHFGEYSYYLGFLDSDINKGNKTNTKDEINKLIGDLQTIIIAPDIKIAKPTYDIAKLNFLIQAASIEFHKDWDARLFGSPYTTPKKEHYARIKALAKRQGSYEGGLYPISDLYTAIMNKIGPFVSYPDSWLPTNANDEQKEGARIKIKNVLGDKILEYSTVNLKINKIKDWDVAYLFRGLGSADERARKVKSIFLDVSPVLENNLSTETNRFLNEIIKITIDSIKENNVGDLKPMYGFNS